MVRRRSAVLGLGLGWLLAAGCGSDDVDFPRDTSSGSGAGVVGTEDLEPAPAGIRRLVARQYANSTRLLFGQAAAAAAAAELPADTKLHGFDTIGNAELAIPPTAVAAYERAAFAAGEAFVADSASLAAVWPCDEAPPDMRACFEDFVVTTGRVAWRRPLAPEEVAAIVDVAMNARDIYASRDEGIVYAVAALLQAPDFAYIVELGEPDPDDPERRRLNPRERLVRTSFFLTDTAPDAAMLDALDGGALETEDDWRELARELLGQAGARDAMRALFAQLYRLDDLEETSKNVDLYPDWSPELARAMVESTLRLIEETVWEGDDARALMTADHAWVNATLAPIYGLSVSGDALVPMPLPANQARAGLMGQASTMAGEAHGASSSPTKRGVFVRRILMCDSVPPPPPEVTFDLPEVDPNEPKTKKELLSIHMEEPACANCHELFDPVGLSFEVFDAIGRHRTEDLGLPIDAAGDQPGLGAFETPADVGQLLFEHEKVPACLVRNVYRHALGHLEEAGEQSAIDGLAQAFAETGYDYQDLLVELVVHPAFTSVGEPR